MTSAEYERPVSFLEIAVVYPGSVVVGVADHRRAAGPPDRGFDLHLDGCEVSPDDLDQDRVGCVGGVWCESVRAHRASRQQHVAEAIDGGGEARMHRHRRTELLQDRGSDHDIAGSEPVPVVDGS